MDEKSQFVVDALSIEESWRIFRIMAEFVDAIETLSKVRHAVSIFGSARTAAGRPLLPEGGDFWPGFSRKRDSASSRAAVPASWRRPTRGPRRPAASPWG